MVNWKNFRDVLSKPHCVLLAFAIIAAITTTACADFRTDALNAHNSNRATHHAPALALDTNLNNQAQAYADKLAAAGGGLTHSAASDRPNQGENLAAGYGNGYSIVTAVNNFNAEEKNYNYNAPGYQPAAGHFTQVVWKSSTLLGVGQAYNATSTYKNYQVFRYSPPGNINTAAYFSANVIKP